MEALEQHEARGWRAAQGVLDPRHAAQRADRPKRRVRRPRADARRRARGGQQLADVVVGDEALGVRAREHDPAYAWLGFGAGDDGLEARDGA